MELTYSKDEGIYGTVASDDGTVRIQFLFSDISGERDDGISIVEGGNSLFEFFVFIPRAIYQTLIDIHSKEVFDESLRVVAEMLIGLPEKPR